MTTAAIYARVSGQRQKEEQTVGSQVAECKTAAASWGLEVPEGWVFTDEGYSGASLVRPALERLRDLAAQVPVDVVVCYSPDRLARKLAYQTLLIDELNKAGSEVRFVKARKVETPEDEMMLQFQGMMAEYERALIMERTRRGKAFRARAGVVNVLGGAPYGYRYVRRSDVSEARYEVVDDEAQLVREMFRRYTEDQVPIGGLARWLTGEKIPTRTGKDRWDRSVIWGMLKNPAYAGRAAFMKTGSTERRPAINRRARLQGRAVSRHHANYDRPKEEWVTIAVPAIVDEATFELAGRRLADNRRFSSRNSKEPSLLMGLVACQSCGYAYYRTSTRTAKRKIYYYRCLGSDDYRYKGGRVCENKPVRADYLDHDAPCGDPSSLSDHAPVLDHSCVQPFADQPQDPLVRDPVLEELQPASVVELVKSRGCPRRAPSSPSSVDPDRQRIQRIMRAAPRPEPVGEAEEVLLVDGVEHLDDGPLDDLVLQRGDAERPQPPVRLRDVHPARRTRPIAPLLDPAVQVPEVASRSCP
jgi:site-specific DNA recombinase